MAYGEHTHEWIYNQAKEVRVNNELKWQVVRFCKHCREVETIELLDNTKI